MKNNITNDILKEKAKEMAKTIIIRSYDGDDYHMGSSQDTERETTQYEKNVLPNIFYGALCSWFWNINQFIEYTKAGEELRLKTILDTAEDTAYAFLTRKKKLTTPSINGYLTVYLRLKEAILELNELNKKLEFENKK